MDPSEQVTDVWVRSDGVRLHAVDWGNPAAPPMLLLHGTASHARLWDRFALGFRSAFHVIALDARGHGESGWPEDFRTGYLQAHWVADIRRPWTSFTSLP